MRPTNRSLIILGITTAWMSLNLLWAPSVAIAGEAATRSQRVKAVSQYNSPDKERTEGLAIDKVGNIYVGGITTGRVFKIKPDGSQSILTKFDIKPGAAMVGLAVDESGNVYAAMNSHNREGQPTHGVWMVRPHGAQELAAAIPDPDGTPNQVSLDRHGNLYITDTTLGFIWRAAKGEKTATKWFTDPRIQAAAKAGNACQPKGVAVNGIAFDNRGDLFVTGPSEGVILHVKVDPKSGAPGAVTEYARDCEQLLGLDQLAIDVQGNVYAAENFPNRIVRITPQKKVEILATAADGLDFPVNISFGPKIPGNGTDKRDQLYFTSLNTMTLLSIDIGIPGIPMP